MTVFGMPPDQCFRRKLSRWTLTVSRGQSRGQLDVIKNTFVESLTSLNMTGS